MVRRAHTRRPVDVIFFGLLLQLMMVTGPAGAEHPKTQPTLNEHGSETLRYRVDVRLADSSPTLAAAIKETSQLIALTAEGAGDFGLLVVRARADAKLIKAVLFEAGHYAGTIRIEIAGQDIDGAQVGVIGGRKGTTEAVPGRQAAVPGGVPVVINVSPGPRFRFGRIELVADRATAVRPPMDPAAYQLIPGRPARSGIVVRAIEQIVEEWRAAGYPFAEVAAKKVAADHATHTLDVRVEINPGRPATYGWLNVTGSNAVSPEMVSRYSGLRPGQTYSTTALRKAGERLRKLDAIESVRIKHGEALDENGGIPITVTVTERKSRFIGAAASVSTVDGGELKAYWGHRNLFGQAERLKIEGAVSQIGNDRLNDLQYVAQATLTVPGVLDIDTDLFTEFRVAREQPETYESRSARFKAGLDRRFNETLSGRVAAAVTVTRDEDAFGTSSYRLVSLPAEIVRDTRDSKLDPTDGWRGSLSAEPAYDFNGSTPFLISRGQVSAYQQLDADGRVVIAARAGLASITGAATLDVPASMRFYGGGSGSVRGFAYQSIGPTVGGNVVGGRGLAEGSVELRWRVTETIGLAGFVDAAIVSADSLPTGAETSVGAGIGLRYYTSLGPIRLDVAVPLSGHDDLGFSDLGIYVGLGQAF